MQLKFASLALGVATLAISASFARPAPFAPFAPFDGPAIGTVAPEINAKGWINQLGAEPNLASLRGAAVMIEFWSTT